MAKITTKRESERKGGKGKELRKTVRPPGGGNVAGNT